MWREKAALQGGSALLGMCAAAPSLRRKQKQRKRCKQLSLYIFSVLTEEDAYGNPSKKKKLACAAYFFLVPACARTGARVLPGGSVDSRFDYS